MHIMRIMHMVDFSGEITIKLSRVFVIVDPTEIERAHNHSQSRGLCIPSITIDFSLFSKCTHTGV